ncbi:hypothetical protein SK128_027975, partial [Halocaridina rubra]
MHDVERYRGSCLIVAKTGKNGGHSQGGRPRPHAPHQEGSASHAPPAAGGLPRLLGGPSPRDNNAFGLDGGGSALTGMPLFSFMHQRRSSCRSIARPHYHHHQHHLGQHHPHHQAHQPLTKGPEGCPSAEGEIEDDVELLPLAQLALHTHGHPLILSPARGGGGGGPPRNSNNGSHSIPPTSTRYPPHFHPQTTTSDPHHHNHHHHRHHQTPSQQASSPSLASDSISVTSDEGSIGHADNCLPRIIKPRKRRKKDRKPTSGSPLLGGGGGGEGDSPPPGTIVTLKPYMPMCYSYSDANKKLHPHKGNEDESKKTLLLGAPSKEAGCGCEHCMTPQQVFPTPPPSPASSSSSAVISSSCSSSSEDEPHFMLHSVGSPEQEGRRHGIICEDFFLVGGGDPSKQLVRSLSEPQSRPALHISSSISPSFAGHRDLDIQIIRSSSSSNSSNRSSVLELAPLQPSMRTRHWSLPAFSRHRQHQYPLHGMNPYSGSYSTSAAPSLLGDREGSLNPAVHT